MGWWEMKDMDDKEIVMTLVSRWPHGLAWKPPPQRRSPFKLQTSTSLLSMIAIILCSQVVSCLAFQVTPCCNKLPLDT
jgi:hypothetical protein